MKSVDFAAPASVFLWPKGPFKKRHPGYRRFETLAEAIAFVMEDMPARGNLQMIQTLDHDLTYSEAKSLYESDAYPLPRTRREG